MNLKKMERYLRVNLLGPGPRLVEKIIYRAAVSQRFRNAGLNSSQHWSFPFLCQIIIPHLGRNIFKKTWTLTRGFWGFTHPLQLNVNLKSIYCKTQFISRQHNSNINYSSISINTQLICYMFRLFWAIIRHTLQELLFFSFVLQFLQ